MDVFRVEVLQRVGLRFEAIVELSEVLDEVLDRLGPLLLFGKRHLQNLSHHSVTLLNIG